ncbi:late competence development ComFB family protein [Sporolactobacillus spathodeae]|uniref:Competence protein ComFB n=1 Tax=Sporolactobacillus spathodeae TaxID=1465502 RepID=A0ABS2QC69_9BACL|nr:late competence development ComFB family protein [Sporolactobacillus spathodeae]MBM7658749.1 competence protein ComFB [Sporolactobacillus spathodeae]
MTSHNVMEDVVYEYLEKHWRDIPVACHCDQCKTDVYTLSLNHLTPYYANTVSGAMYAKADLMTVQSRANILAVLTTSAKTVSQHPHHANN